VHVHTETGRPEALSMIIRPDIEDPAVIVRAGSTSNADKPLEWCGVAWFPGAACGVAVQAAPKTEAAASPSNPLMTFTEIRRLGRERWFLGAREDPGRAGTFSAA
jgi:hypothetical protein